MEAQEPLTGSRKDMLVSVGWMLRSIVLPEKRFVWKIRSTPPFSCFPFPFPLWWGLLAGSFLFFSFVFFSFFFNVLGGLVYAGPYLSSYSHTARRKQIRIRTHFGRQHAIFDIGDEIDQVLDFLIERGGFEAFGLVRVHGFGSCACFDVDGHYSSFLFFVSSFWPNKVKRDRKK